MKYWTLEHGNDVYNLIYNDGPVLHHLVDNEKALVKSYTSWAQSREKSCLRICFYERSETGVMDMYDKFEWSVVKPRPRVINKPVETAPADFNDDLEELL